jgi:hypothetical protein
MDVGGALWLIINVLFVVVLAAAIAYGAYQWGRERP